MLKMLENIAQETLRRLSDRVTTYLPGLLAALSIFLTAWAVAWLTRRVLLRIFKGTGVDRFMRRSGLSALLAPSGTIRTSSLVAGLAFWAILAAGFLTALDVFDTQLTTAITASLLSLAPRLLTAALILLAGLWLAKFLSHGALVWAFEERIPAARRIALGVRILVVFTAAAVTADYLHFAEHVFLAAFIIVVGGAVLAVSLAVGLEGRHAIRRFVRTEQPPPGEAGEELGGEPL